MKQISVILFMIAGIHGLWGQNLTAFEYFFDTDPGIGNGTPLILISPSDTVDFTTGASTAGLVPGFHTLFVRAKDSNGTWSLYARRNFYLEANPPGNSASLVKWEYFFDTDPGPGNGPSGLISATDTSELQIAAATAGLSTGFHTLYFRTQDATGLWGLPQSRSFYVEDTSNLIVPRVLSYELFLDSMSGVGNGFFAFDLGPDDTLNYNIGLNLGFLNLNPSPGFHQLLIRWKDTAGVWGLYHRRSLYVEDPANLQPAAPIEVVEHYFNADPGIGMGSQLSYPPSDTLEENINVLTSSLGLGNHIIGVRVRDTAGKWSLVVEQPFTIGTCPTDSISLILNQAPPYCEGDQVTLSVLDSYVSYQWSNGATSDTIVVNQSGTYSVLVTDTAGCQFSSHQFTMDFLPAPPTPGIQVLDDDTLAATVFGVAYEWFFNFNSLPQTTRKIKALASGTYQVALFDDFGCRSDKSDFFTYTLTGLTQLGPETQLLLFPNPHQGHMNLQVNRTQAGALNLVVYSALGQALWQARRQVEGGENALPMDLSHLAEGAYYLHVSDGIQGAHLPFWIRR